MRKFSNYSCLFLGAIMTGASQAPAAEQYVVGVSNTLVGNGWREEMVCSIKAEALASGKVSKVILANRNGGPSEQIADLRNLISAGVNIIIVNPSDRKALDPVIKQATDRHIVVVAVDQAVDAPTAYVLSNDQTAYGREGAEALFKKLGGKGNVVEMRGIDGVPADNNGFMGQAIELKDAGLVGIAVTNPPAVGAAGLSVAIDVLEGKQHPHLIHLTPEVHDNTTPEGVAWLKAYYDPKLDPTLPVYGPVKPYTHYTLEQEKACKGPG